MEDLVGKRLVECEEDRQKRGIPRERGKRRRDDTLDMEEEKMMYTPSRKTKLLLKEGGEMIKKKEKVQLRLTQMMEGNRPVSKEEGTELRRGRGDSTKKRKRKKEEEWKKVVAGNLSIKNYFKPSTDDMRGVIPKLREVRVDISVHGYLFISGH